MNENTLAKIFVDRRINCEYHAHIHEYPYRDTVISVHFCSCCAGKCCCKGNNYSHVIFTTNLRCLCTRYDDTKRENSRLVDDWSGQRGEQSLESLRGLVLDSVGGQDPSRALRSFDASCVDLNHLRRVNRRVSLLQTL